MIDDFNLMAASLERLETEPQTTTATMAHELRTPLAVLQARLAEDLRHLSLADAGKLNLSFGPPVSAKRVRLLIQARPAPLSGDAVRLRQIITNLLDNTLKLTPQTGCITVTVTTSAPASPPNPGHGFSSNSLFW